MNVILVVVDTLRARSMSCYGYDKPTCPNIDAFARQGVLFEKARSVVHNTHPAFTTMMTGMYPITHRIVRMNGNYALEQRRFRLLPQLMQLAGFKTVALDNLEAAGSMVKASWMNRGYDEYFNFSARGEGTGHQKKRLFTLNRTAFRMMDDLKGKPFFMFLHCWDTHAAYIPRGEFAARWYQGDRSKRILYGEREEEEFDESPTGRCLPTGRQPDPENVRFTHAMYDASIADMDDAFGALLRRLDETGLAEDTLVILTSDHGENLAEHQIIFNHRWNYEDCIAIPMIMRWPKGLPAGKRVAAFAQQTDIAPTILDLVGAPPEDVMDGISLAPVMRGQTGETYPFAFSHATIPDTRRAIQDERYKYIEWLENCPREADIPAQELYDLASDPRETKNIIDQQPAVAKRLQTELRRWVDERVEDSKKLFGIRRLDPLVEQAWHGHIPYPGTPRWFR